MPAQAGPPRRAQIPWARVRARSCRVWNWLLYGLGHRLEESHWWGRSIMWATEGWLPERPLSRPLALLLTARRDRLSRDKGDGWLLPYRVSLWSQSFSERCHSANSPLAAKKKRKRPFHLSKDTRLMPSPYLRDDMTGRIKSQDGVSLQMRTKRWKAHFKRSRCHVRSSEATSAPAAR